MATSNSGIFAAIASRPAFIIAFATCPACRANCNSCSDLIIRILLRIGVTVVTSFPSTSSSTWDRTNCGICSTSIPTLPTPLAMFDNSLRHSLPIPSFQADIRSTFACSVAVFKSIVGVIRSVSPSAGTTKTVGRPNAMCK